MEAERTDHTDTLERDTRRLTSECWIYTRERGLRAVTLHGNGATIAVDGQRLHRWHVLERGSPDVAVALVYSAEMPTTDVQDSVARAARERFQNEPTFCQATTRA